MLAKHFLTMSIAALLLTLSAIGADAVEQLHRQQRAATSYTNDLWTNGRIYYSFDDSISPRLQGLIQDAMTEWQDATCLLFLPRNQEEDYIKFYSRPNREYCTSDSVGRRGGEQAIELGYSCQSKGELLHTLGHVIGLWNEQARPDRNSYVQILTENIERGQEANFQKREDFAVDYQGNEYDFGSIMHLSATAYSKDGSPTTQLLPEHANVGEDSLGQRDRLSDGDKEQVNTLYSCPTRRVQPGKLKVMILEAKGLTQTASPFVEVTAVDSDGREEILRTTQKIRGQDDVRNPVWEETLEFPVQQPMDWQFFKIRILDQNDDILAMPKTVHIEPGEYTEYTHCITANQNCNEFMKYGYEYILDGDECDPDSCKHGDCTDLFVDYMCICERGYDGKNCDIDVSGDSCYPNPCDPNGSLSCEDGFFDFTCECRLGYVSKDCSVEACNPNPCANGGTCYPNGNVAKGYTCSCTSVWDPASDCRQHESRCLSIKVKGASDLPGGDGPGNKIDPYINLWIHDNHGRTKMGQSHHVGGTHNPVWNYEFNTRCEHGERVWVSFNFEVWDDDDFLTFGDDFLVGGHYNLQDINIFPHCNLEIRHVTFEVYYYNMGDTNGDYDSICQQ